MSPQTARAGDRAAGPGHRDRHRQAGAHRRLHGRRQDRHGAEGRSAHAAATAPRDRMSSFVGYVPADDPALVILVVIDTPRTATYGGVVAAPVFRAVAEYGLARRGVLPRGDAGADGAATPAPRLPHRRCDHGQAARADGGTRSPRPAACRASSASSMREALVRAHTEGWQVRVEGSGYVIRQDPPPGAVDAPIAASPCTLAPTCPDAMSGAAARRARLVIDGLDRTGDRDRHGRRRRRGGVARMACRHGVHRLAPRRARHAVHRPARRPPRRPRLRRRRRCAPAPRPCWSSRCRTASIARRALRRPRYPARARRSRRVHPPALGRPGRRHHRQQRQDDDQGDARRHLRARAARRVRGSRGRGLEQSPARRSTSHSHPPSSRPTPTRTT